MFVNPQKIFWKSKNLLQEKIFDTYSVCREVMSEKVPFGRVWMLLS